MINKAMWRKVDGDRSGALVHLTLLLYHVTPNHGKSWTYALYETFGITPWLTHMKKR